MSAADPSVLRMACSAETTTAADPADAHQVSQWLDRLNVSARTETAARLAGGQSKARVYLLELDGDRCVLKVTDSQRWRPQALREMRLYRELAPDLPISIPRLLGSTVVAEGVAVLISAHGRRTAAIEWSDDQFINAAVQAAELHRHGRYSPPPKWVHQVRSADEQSVARAAAAWHHLGHPAIAEQVRSLVADVTGLLMRAAPTLIHGDCHADNLLTSGEAGLVWVDWQEVTTGAGPEDLAFLLQRAEFDGSRPPRAAMTAAYKAGSDSLLEGSVERLLLAAELRLLLLEWPHFLPHGDNRQQETMLSRLHEARQQWAG